MGAQERQRWQYLRSSAAVLCGRSATASNSPALAHSCLPMLYMELNCATLQVCAAAYRQGTFLCEPLTTALHLYCMDNATHMQTLVRCMCAIRCTLLKLAEFYQVFKAQPPVVPFRQFSDGTYPYLFGKAYPGAEIHQLLPNKLVFLVTHLDLRQTLVKFVACGQPQWQLAQATQCAWAGAGFALQLVGSLHVCTLTFSLLA